MNRHLRLWLVAALIFAAASCSEQQPVEEIKKSVEVVVQTANGPVAGASIKVVDEQSAANALAALAIRADLKGAIPEPEYGKFFQSLAVAPESEVLTTDAAGKAVIQRLRGQYFVVAEGGRNLWLASASETRNRNLTLGAENEGGQRALQLLISNPGINDALVSAARQAFTRAQFDQARALALASGSTIVATEITRGEVSHLLKQAEVAIESKNYEAARADAARANALIPDEPAIRALLDRILAEYGGELRTFAAHSGAVLMGNSS